MDLFFAIALLLAGLGTAAAVIGARLPKTHVAASRIRLNAPPDQLFGIVTLFEGYAAWRPGLDRVEMGPIIGGMPSWFEICSRISRVQFRVVEMRPPHHLVTCIVNDKLPLSGQWSYRFEPDGDATLITITAKEKIHHPLLRFFDRFILSYHGVMDVYLIALARKLGQPVMPEHLSVKRDAAEPAV